MSIIIQNIFKLLCLFSLSIVAVTFGSFSNAQVNEKYKSGNLFSQINKFAEKLHKTSNWNYRSWDDIRFMSSTRDYYFGK